jgi:hypothetical protein
MTRGQVWILTCVVLGFASVAEAGKWEGIERLPGQSPVTVLVESKERIYFRVTPEKPLAVAVEGPVRLRILSRAELAPGSRGVVSYTLRVTEAGRELDRQDTESSASDQVRGPDRAHAIAKGRRMKVDVPAGRHSVVLAVSGIPSVLVRLQQSAPSRGEEPTVTLTPIESSRSVSVLENEKTIAYHSVMANKPIKLRVEGPTSLDLITRLDFDSSMRGSQSYRLGVSDRGKRVRELAFKTTKATTAVYTNLADRVPSKFDRVRIPVGAGLHEISIELLAPKQGVAEVHARIPEPKVGDQE